MKALAIIAALVVPALAQAQSFEALAEGATTVSRLDDIVWAFTGACTAGDDLHQRQCRLVRDKRQKALAGAILLVDGETAALELTKWSPQKRSLGITVTSCIRCAGIEVEGKKWLVIGAGAPARFEGQRLRTHVLHDSTQTFADEASATAWTKSLERARVQYIVKVGDKPKWNANGKEGLAFEVLGYRVIAPCDGSIVASSPPSSMTSPDKKLCSGATVVADPSPVGPRPEKLPDALSGVMIKQAMKPVMDAANACYARYKVTGRAKLVMTIDNEGKVVEYVQEGEFVGTPTATCIDTAVKRVTFPRTQKPRTKVGFPIVLQ
ncbi:MAG: hypothetical protein M4D80_06840 [Myxococcota bacterium]|nr:hypothetical protein [Deltaproteobacteria bacterium]MDQ3334857.1 hypothetical protein [Myxococcota bacterium]